MTTQSNMTPMQEGAHAIVAGNAMVESGIVTLTNALAQAMLATVCDAAMRLGFESPLNVLTFEHNGETHTRNFPLDYLNGETKADGKGDQKLLYAHWTAIRTNQLGIETLSDEADNKLRSSLVRCTRAAAGFWVAGAKVSKWGNLMLPASEAVEMFDDTGTATKVGRAVFEEAERRAIAKAEVVAEVSGADVVAPEEEEVWEQAAAMMVEATGKQHATFGKVPTNSDVVKRLQEVAEESGVIAPRKKRAPRAATAVDEGEVFDASVKYLTDFLAALRNSDESTVDINDTRIAALAALANEIAAL